MSRSLPIYRIWLCSVLATSFVCTRALAADDGLDSIWMDHVNENQVNEKNINEKNVNEKSMNGKSVAKPSTEAPGPAPASSSSSAATETSVSAGAAEKTSLPATGSADGGVSTSSETAGVVAPMCTLDEFAASSLISRTSWPGLGPFKAQADSRDGFMDEANNTVKLELVDGKIVRAVLTLAAKSGEGGGGYDLLDIEMSTDFLLEALGARSNKIVSFNNSLEKNREIVAAASAPPLNLTAGRLSVTIERVGTAGSVQVAVNSLDANKAVINEHANPGVAKQPGDKTVESPAGNLDGINIWKPATPGDKTKTTGGTNTSQKQPAKAGQNRNEEFTQVIRKWQQIKKEAVRKRDASHLSDVLAGKVLVVQNNAVKWLVNNHRYYDMTPKGVSVEKVQEQAPGQKYLVTAKVSESSKYIDEASGQVLKETDTPYVVDYTIEKISDKWFITGSALLSNDSTASPGKTLTPKR